jgi:hypothetical protein
MTRRISLVVAIAALSLFVPAAASAGPRVPTWASRGVAGTAPAAPIEGPGFSISRRDGNDTNGALDLRSMKITRGGTKDTILFTNDDGVSNADIEDHGNFAILIDIDANHKDFEFGQYVFFASGKLRGVLVNLDTNHVVDRTAPTSRVNARAFRTVIQRSKIDSPGTYRFAVFSYNEASPCTKKKPCIDAIPNTYPLIPLDHKAPTVHITSLDQFANDASGALTTELSFTFADDEFGTGVKSWVVQRKEVGAGTGWEQVKKGTSKHPSVNLPGEEGATYDVRVIVVDKQKNKKVSASMRTTFAYDDRNAAAVSYTGTTTQNTPVGSFLGTTTAVAQTGTATFAFDGGDTVCVMGGPAATGKTADVTATLDTVAVDVSGWASETDATDARFRTGCVAVVGTGAHTLVLTVTSVEPYVIDGFYVAR